MSPSRLAKRATSLSAMLSLVATGAIAVASSTAQAAAAPPGPPPVAEPTANNVTADPLPTVQIDGVVWSQAIVGNTVYAGGNFANARPAGAAPGTNLTPRSDLLAYDLTTGELNTSFAPQLNGQVKSVVASPDGSRVYVGGSFTSADGKGRYRLAAFDTATGALISTFKPILSTTVNAIVATNTTVYVGGVFTIADGVARNRLAAFNASDGALTAWDPNADYTVNALVLTPDGSRIIAGGAFQNVGAQPEYGLAAIDAVTGGVLPWAANQTVRNAGTVSAIESLTTDGTAVYGTGYVFGAGGNLEGTFSADPDSGAINWIEDCHGDTYDAYAARGIVYTVSHAHFCGNVGGFPQTPTPWVEHRTLAFTSTAAGTVQPNSLSGYANWSGNAAPSQYNWYPDLTTGTFTGQGQAAWDVTGNGQYVVLGGEFTRVNYNGGQQGLVRFGVRSVSTGKQGPRVEGASFEPAVVPTSTHSARISWQANWDRDNENLSYKLIRNDAAGTPIYTTTTKSQFWNRPSLDFTDTGLTPGATYTYKVYAVDPSGNTTRGSDVSVTMPTRDPSGYLRDVVTDGASDYWRLGESSGTTAADLGGFNNLVEGSTVGHGAAGVVSGNAASTFDGTATGTAGSTTAVTSPSTFSVEAWIKTTTTQGGKIVGFGSARTGSSPSNDRHLYMDNIGHILFGVSSGGVKTVTSAGMYNNGQWHHLVGSLSPSGMALYVDGVRVASNAATTSAVTYMGYWRVGGDNLTGWPAQPTDPDFAGSIDEVAVYPGALTAAQVAAHYAAAG